jgi:hypothetical protein
LGSLTTDGARCTSEIKTRIAVPKAAFNRKKTLSISTVDSNLRIN